MKDYKLNEIGKRASFFAVEDFVSGKKAVLEIVRYLAPVYSYNTQMLLRTCALEFDLEYMIEKSHIHE